MSTVAPVRLARAHEAIQITAFATPRKAGRAPTQNSGSRRVWESASSGKKQGLKLDEAVRGAITKAGLGFLSSLREVSEKALPKKVAAALEAFAEVNSASGQGCSVGGLKLGKEQVYVLSGANENSAVVFSAVDSKGNPLAQAQLTIDDQYRLTMSWVGAKGQPGAVICTMQYDKKGDITDADWIKKAEAAFADCREKNEDFGQEVEAHTLPPTVRAQYDFLARRASDSYGVRAFEVDGKKAYMLCDYACVSTYYAVAPNGRLLFDYAS